MLLFFLQANSQNSTTKKLNSNQLASKNSINELLQGKWQKINDKTNYLVFENNQRKEMSKGMNKWQIEPYILSNMCLNEFDKDGGYDPENNKYISCEKSDMCWYIENISKAYLTLGRMGFSESLKYKRIK